MSRKNELTGSQVKEALSKVVGGVYFGNIGDFPTDYLDKMTIEDYRVRFEVDANITLTLSIDESATYTNHAVVANDEEGCEDEPYFDYRLEIDGYSVCFNTEDKGTELTWEWLVELIKSGRMHGFDVRSDDSGSVYIDMNECIVSMDENEIEICSRNSVIIDRGIVDAIYNDTTAQGICYRLEFNNGMSDICIEPTYLLRRFSPRIRELSRDVEDTGMAEMRKVEE